MTPEDAGNMFLDSDTVEQTDNPSCHHQQSHSHHRLQDQHENCQGDIVGPCFELVELCLKSDYLEIYKVKCVFDGTQFEAQAFSLSLPHGGSDGGAGTGKNSDCKLLEARRRRMRRIYRSRNFVESFAHENKRFLVSRVQRSDAEWDDMCHQIERHENKNLQKTTETDGVGSPKSDAGIWGMEPTYAVKPSNHSYWEG